MLYISATGHLARHAPMPLAIATAIGRGLTFWVSPPPHDPTLRVQVRQGATAVAVATFGRHPDRGPYRQSVHVAEAHRLSGVDIAMTALAELVFGCPLSDPSTPGEIAGG